MTKKTIKRASADVGLIFCAYNLRRIFNLIDQNELKQYLKILDLLFGSVKGLFKAFCDFIFIATTKSLFPEKDIIVV
ncbi:hypothetical protein QLS31_14545 [Flavobacterium sp. XS2P24]|uniref:hypothetical protein n=1 Tax=Flavobacterium sp. XS2P24 TaxID=3041249 RepID=UPI0024A833BB|nr:hypothetical protein [Flavobacterium sp. XS2P24]MDI6051047.1 hypothetical protein [Flavobacterium sp. XS2P24]